MGESVERRVRLLLERTKDKGQSRKGMNYLKKGWLSSHKKLRSYTGSYKRGKNETQRTSLWC